MNANDINLITDFQQGKPEAYNTLYHQFAAPLRFYAQQLVLDHQVAEDITAEALIKTFQKHQDFNSLSAVKGYLYISVSNAAFDHLKIKKRHERTHDDLRYLTTGDIDDTELAYIRAEALRAVYEAIEKLPEKPREVIRLLFIEGKKLPEIAALMNLSYNTVQNYRGKGIELLRMELITSGLLSGAGLVLALSLLEMN